MASLMRCEPFGRLSLTPVRNEFDRVFDRFFQSWPTLCADLEARHGIDVHDKEDAILVRVEAPGFEVEDFDLQIHGDILNIRASRKQEAKDKDDGFSEWSRSEIHRSIPLSAEIESDNVDAKYKNGVLTIHIPKTPEAKPKRIAVKA